MCGMCIADDRNNNNNNNNDRTPKSISYTHNNVKMVGLVELSMYEENAEK